MSLRAALSTTDQCVVTKTGPGTFAFVSEVAADEAVEFNATKHYHALYSEAILNRQVLDLGAW